MLILIFLLLCDFYCSLSNFLKMALYLVENIAFYKEKTYKIFKFFNENVYISLKIHVILKKIIINNAKKHYNHILKLQKHSSILIYRVTQNVFFIRLLLILFSSSRQNFCWNMWDIRCFSGPLNYRKIHLVVFKKFNETSKIESVWIFMAR